MTGSFCIANKLVWQFNGETFLKHSMELVSSPEKWTLRGCLYRNRNKMSHPYWSRDQKLFAYMVYLQGMSHRFEINVINALQ